MSEDDRAARAARAKALLNRRRQQKAGAGPEPTVPPSRTESPAPSEQPDNDKGRDPAELFSRGDADASWISSLPRPTSPPARSIHVAPRQSATNGQGSPLVDIMKHGSTASHANLKDIESKLRGVEAELEAERSRFQQFMDRQEQERHRLESLLDDERQTVSLLVSEKSNLAAELHRLGGMESRAHEFESMLTEEQKKSTSLETRMTRLQSDHGTVSDQLRRAETSEKELGEQCRDRERQLQLANATIVELRKEHEHSQRRVRELEEQIQSDDRVEHLEESLKNTQDRADELEFQLSILRQSQTTLRSERDELERQCHALQEKELDLEQKNADLREECTQVMQELAEATLERDNLVSEKISLQSQADKTESSAQELRRMLDHASSELAVQARQLQTVNGNLRAATRRAEEAEKIQKDLQLEGMNLMRSLDEMRPKIIGLTSEKLNLTEKVEILQRASRDYEGTVDELKSSLNDARSKIDQTNKEWQQKWSQRENERAETAHAGLQDQLENTLRSLHNLESQRATQHQELVRKSNEIENLNATAASQRDELSALKEELEAQRSAEDQFQDLLDQARDEIESLRFELRAREEECEHLQSHAAMADGPSSLDNEFIASLRQQHALDLSAAQSQIRALEDSVFNAETKSHTLQQQIAYLEDQLRHTRSTSHINRSFSRSPVPSRPASRNEIDLRRSSFGSHRAVNPAASPLSRTVIDPEMSLETINKRKISLSMLKARMQGEMAQPPSRALSPVNSLRGGSRPASPAVEHRHSQFLDDSHVFWCSSCRGDLVIL
ncbi:hypothetical protein APHAL10511_005956 [Amanita phalloides]|nr:hypothetical protein APHAL10511_005956 [Amanita phalloides]